ncbi:MAG: uridine kinase [Acidimicrobiales bacterium]
MDRPELWGICGGSGSGKTTLAIALLERLSNRAALLSLDSYYRDLSHLSFDERCRVNFDHPDAVDFDLFIDHLDALHLGRAVPVPRYDFNSHCRNAGTDWLDPGEVVIVEGILLMARDDVRERLDLAVYLDVPAAIRLDRRVHRDVTERGRDAAEVRAVFETVVRPMEELFVEPAIDLATIRIEHPFEAEHSANRLHERLVSN